MTDAAVPGTARTQATEPAVPERPQRAPGVELRGQMTESAFKDPPWLIERDGSYIRVPRLLYVVLDQAGGDRTLQQIADKVSEVIKRQVSADDIRQITANLVQSGLVLTSRGEVAQTEVSEQAAAISPLSVNMRMAMISPRVIETATGILKVLFWPPILLTALAIAAFAEAWIYFVHGIGGGLRQALYTPGLMLILLTAIVLAAAFHEFGHASALRYAGGRVGRMGAGFYMAYPAFYTDVTDNYRLPRWSRVRTDLGGFYFHLLFALGVMALFAATGWEALLLIVLLINIEIIHQLMPFIRLDGYWTLADLIGIPDFFSHIGPFLRTVLPLGFWKGPKMPDLKTWAKVVFFLYIAVTIPMLGFLLVLLIAGLPRVLATAWDSFWKQWQGFQGALPHGDILTVATSAVQMLVLALMTFGLLFFLFTLARSLGTRVWNWSRPTWRRRLVGAFGTVGLLALLALLFMPATPLTGGHGGPLGSSLHFEPLQGDENLTLPDLSRAAVSGLAPVPASPAALGSPSTATSDSPAPTASATSASLSASPEATAAPTAGPTGTASASPSPSPTPSPTPTPSPVP